MADDETIVTLEPETLGPQKAEGDEQPTVVKTTETHGGAEADAVDAFKTQYEEAQRLATQRQADAERERNARMAAEAETRRARESEAAARGEIADTQLSSVESGLEAATTSRVAAKAAYKSAMEVGDWTAAAEAQDQLATAAAQIERLNEAKADLTVRKAQRTEQTEAPQRQQQQIPGDPVEAFISSRTAPTQSWLRAHPDHARAMARFMTGQASPEEAKVARKLSAASSDAEAEGFALDSAEYFAHVENFVGLKKAAAATTESKPNGQQQPRRRSVPAAPVNGGSSAGGSGGGAVEVRLAPHESVAAKDGTHVWLESDLKAGRIKDKALVGEPIGEREFARRKYLMQQQGLYDRSFLEQ